MSTPATPDMPGQRKSPISRFVEGLRRWRDRRKRLNAARDDQPATGTKYEQFRGG
jgi:hypothetical protein